VEPIHGSAPGGTAAYVVGGYDRVSPEFASNFSGSSYLDRGASGGVHHPWWSLRNFRGAYTFKGGVDSPNLSVTKLGGSGDVGPRHPLGIGDMTWNLSLGGNIGHISADATIKEGILEGNELSASTFGIEFGAGRAFGSMTILASLPRSAECMATSKPRSTRRLQQASSTNRR
jgi:hypothetical protein